jgi:hypothetical protein
VKTWTYHVYGLVIRSAMALPGMPEAAGAGEPDLFLEIAGEHRAPEGRGPSAAHAEAGRRLPDGERLSIEPAQNGAHLFRYGNQASFELCSDGRLIVAPSEASGSAYARHPALLRVLMDFVLPVVSLQRGFAVMRAGAVEQDGGVIAFVSKKHDTSALAAEFTRRGHPLVCGAVLALHRSHDVVWAHPGPPHYHVALRPGCDTASTTLGVTIATLRDGAWVVAPRSAARRGPLTGVYVLEDGAGPHIKVVRAPATPAAVLPYALALDRRLTPQRECPDVYGALAARVPMYRLSAPPGTGASALADAVLSAPWRASVRRPVDPFPHPPSNVHEVVP